MSSFYSIFLFPQKHEELQRNYQEVLKNYETFKTALLADHLRDVKTKH